MEPVWWKVVKQLAGFIHSGRQEDELATVEVRDELLARGFAEQDVYEAYAWLDRANRSGVLTESLSMLQPQTSGSRVDNPIEKLFFSDELWEKIQSLRFRGLLSSDLVERLLEGMRTMDTRDWDEEDITNLMHELLSVSLPFIDQQHHLDIIEGQRPEFYS
tara:strand:+ start:365 stop:847 length:483 start_codon:yes stop_codon:yes gene_type:complete